MQYCRGTKLNARDAQNGDGVMPKEIIESSYYDQLLVDVNTGKSVRAEPTYMHVGWTKDHKHVEVAVINRDIKVEFPGDTREGWFMQMDREGCNRAIKALRKARDDAFGRDQ